jgi:hypothetical protein
MTKPHTDETAPHLPWAQTQTLPYAARPVPAQPESAPPMPPEPALAQRDAAGVDPHQPDAQSAGAMPDTAPALNPPTWSGRKTAIAAALAIGISSMGAVAAAAALPVGTTPGGGQVQQGRFGPGGRLGGFNQQAPQQGTQQGTQPGGTAQLPGGQVPQGPGQGGPGSSQQAPADPSASTT